jgi:hypothetical protein
MSSRRVLEFVGAAVLLGGAAAGCDLGSLLDVEDPSRISTERAESPELAAALVNGVEANFVCGYGLFISMVANLSELDSGTFIGEPLTINRRKPTALDVWQKDDCNDLGGTDGSYVPLAKARATADDLVSLLESWTDAEVSERQPRLARALLLSGFSLSGLGTGFCSGALDEGPELSSIELFAEAESRFDRAIQLGSSLGLTTIVNAATLGRARMRLYQGNTSGALSDAEAIPEGFSFTATTLAAGPETANRVHYSMWLSGHLGIAEWTRNLTVDGVPDPRLVGVTEEGTLMGDGRPLWGLEKYRNADDPLPVARWEEAQLIIAEIEGGQRAVNIINALREPYGLEGFASTDEAEIRDEVFDERRRELFVEGFRAYDVRRANLPLFPPVGADYSWEFKKFGTYGTATCVPLPAVETLNNPNI